MNKNSIPEKFRLVRNAIYGDEIQKDYKKAADGLLDVIAVSLEDGDVENLHRALELLTDLARCYFDNDDEYLNNKQEAVRLWEIAASHNNKGAHCYLGWINEAGQNYPLAFQHYKKSIEEEGKRSYPQEDEWALGNLGYCYDQGWGVEQDHQQAYTCYQRAAALDNAEALNNLASLKLHGLYLRKNYGEAFELFEQAAKKNFPAALNSLGWSYENGYGVKQDLHQALFYYKKAASQLLDVMEDKDWKCFYLNSGWLYETGGRITCRSYYQAPVCALYNIGRLYENGFDSFPQNISLAIRCYREAAEFGYPKAQQALARLELESPRNANFHPVLN